MKRVCPHCGKKSKISCHAYKPTKYSVYNRISKYKCRNCGGHLIRSKNKPSIKDNIVISIITLVSGVLFYTLLCEFQSYDIYDILLTISIMFCIGGSAYFDLGLIDTYCPKKLLPADERDILYIPKPNATVTFENQIPKKLNRYDKYVFMRYENGEQFITFTFDTYLGGMVGIPSDKYNIYEIEVNGNKAIVSKEDSQMILIFLSGDNVFNMFTQDVDYSECEKIINSIY